jgi:IS30 family transposase
MAGSGRRGPAPLTDKREQFARLVEQGVSNSEACRQVGINRRTGTRWRFGRQITGAGGATLEYPPVTATELRVMSPRYLSEADREAIAELRRAGLTLREIGDRIGRNASTISRELKRNVDSQGAKYRPAVAHRMAVKRRARPRQRRVDRDPVLAEFVQERLAERWSPEQISRALTDEFPDEAARHLVPESIYKAIYDRRCSLTRDRVLLLRTRRLRRLPHRQANARRSCGLPAPMKMIGQRPASVRDRVEPGHWEGDFIMGAANLSAIGTLVERTSRKTVLVHMGADKTAAALRDALVAIFAEFPPWMRRTLTWDQGREMSSHLDISRLVGIDVFFCEKSSPWQRGTNENTNGLLRDYFPKGTDLRIHSAAHLLAVAEQLNNRPRKILEWATPAKVFRRHELSPPSLWTPRESSSQLVPLGSNSETMLRRSVESALSGPPP